MDILGGIVLIDPETGEPYAPNSVALSSPASFGVGLLGSVVLIDPETGEPYSLEHS